MIASSNSAGEGLLSWYHFEVVPSLRGTVSVGLELRGIVDD